MPTDPELEQTAWDLEPLVDCRGQDGARAQLVEALIRSQAFATRYVGKLGELDSAGLEQAMRELGEIQELVGRAGTYAGLRFSVDTADPAAGALMQEVQERGTEIETTLLFFELEWAALDDEQAEELLDDERLVVLRASPAQRASLPRAPALRTGGEDPRREGGHRSECMVAPVRRAHFGDRGAPAGRCR